VVSAAPTFSVVSAPAFVVVFLVVFLAVAMFHLMMTTHQTIEKTKAEKMHRKTARVKFRLSLTN
ncbi:hypothetical protein, partial [uncultured Parasutterella sp.]|uniref:hypothetical protein n=1 Tax=uncultured Parasutterella sp. TaxID=1263098 RepID=UPI002631C082